VVQLTPVAGWSTDELAILPGLNRQEEGLVPLILP
jgi:hypothetical protein